MARLKRTSATSAAGFPTRRSSTECTSGANTTYDSYKRQTEPEKK